MWIAFDDTDSVEGMCTTYLASLICREIEVEGLPKLVRLNPNIPYKTRGNGACVIKTSDINAKHISLDLLKRFSRLNDVGTNPAMVFFEGDKIPEPLKEFYKSAVSKHIEIDEAISLAKSFGIEYHLFNNGRGIIGSLAALGYTDVSTYELIAYRKSKKQVGERQISHDSVFEMNDLFYPDIFDSIYKKNILITPRGKDPVFCGIRGVTSKLVDEAYSIIKPLEEIEFFQIFETNQASDDHLVEKKINEIKPYDCLKISGMVSSNPTTIVGGHIIFKLSDGMDEIDCAAYEPTEDFRKIVNKFVVGDKLIVCGGVSEKIDTLNIEKLSVTYLMEVQETIIPKCCGKKMKSAGSSKGVKCRKCSNKVSLADLETRLVSRGLVLGIYEVPPGVRRHLNRPIILDSICGL